MKIYKKSHRMFIKYVFGAGFFAGLDILLLYIFKEYGGLQTYVASTCSFIIALVLGFLYQKYYTFGDKKSKILLTFGKFTAYQISSYFIYMGILWLGTSVRGIYYIFVAGFGKIITFLWNFIMNRYFNFSFDAGK